MLHSWINPAHQKFKMSNSSEKSRGIYCESKVTYMFGKKTIGPFNFNSNKSGQKNESSSILCKIVIVLLKGVNFRQIFVELVVLVKVIYHFLLKGVFKFSQ